jgi:proton-dependent oligopeptide transporter, POT family
MTQDPTSEFASASAAGLAGGHAPPDHPGEPADRSWFGHPRGLSTLFFTEFWERFSFYGMRALLILFMTAAVAEGGLGWDANRAGAVYGLYVAFVYLTALPGGWLADRVFGQRHAVLVGGIVIAAGHFSLAIPGTATFFLGLLLVVVGTGLLKPNISTMVADLYPEGGARRDAGFSIFYMGINLGAFAAPMLIGPLRQAFGWHFAFGLAGVGMVLGLVQYVVGMRRLGDAGAYRPQPGEREGARARRFAAAAGVVALVGALLWMLDATGVYPLTVESAANAGGAVIVFIAITYFAFMYVAGGMDATERRRFGAIVVLFLASVVFWGGFEQAGSSLNLFADRMTDREVLGRTIPTEWLQSVNSAFIILLAPVFAGIWIALSRRRLEPSSPVKFAIGLVAMGSGFLVMMMAATLAARGVQVSPGWLVLTYLLHTIGELSLSPVGLSTVTKLAPRRMVGQMMGVWFLAISLGGFVAGRAGGQFETMPLPQLFGTVAAVGIVAGLVLGVLARPMRRLMAGVH